MSNYNPNTQPYYELPLLGFDTETTGIDVKEDHVITCNVTYDEPGQDQLVVDWILQPAKEIPTGASDVHGITTEYAQQHGKDPYLSLKNIHEHLATWESYGYPLVAFNAAYDCTLLMNEWWRYGIKPEVTFRRVIDPFVLDKKAFPYRQGNRKLTRLAELYDVKLENAHSADADVAATLGVARKLPGAVDTSKINFDMPVDRLHAYQVIWKYEQAESLEAYFHGKGGKPDAYVAREWPVIFGKSGN